MAPRWERTASHIKVLAESSRYHAMLQDFPDIIRPAGIPREPRHSAVHHICTTPGPPSRARRLAPDRLLIAKSEFEETLRNGTARRSDSPWASPLHLVTKKEDGWRQCGEYRAWALGPSPTNIPFGTWPTLHNLLAAKSSPQLIWWNHTIRFQFNRTILQKQPSSRPLGFSISRICPSGSETPRKHFSGSSMRHSRDLDFCYEYTDDVLVASTSEDEHEQHLRTLFQCFSEYVVLLNPAICVLGATEVTFLGHTVSAEGTRPLEERVAAINRFQQPVFIKDLRRFLGMLNFTTYHKPPAYKRRFTLRWLVARSKDHNRWTGHTPWSTLSRTARLASPVPHFWLTRTPLLRWPYLQTPPIMQLAPPSSSVSATLGSPWLSTHAKLSPAH